MGMKEIIRFHAVAYSKASISKKTAIIDGIVAATNMNRKSVIRALKRESIWLMADVICRPNAMVDHPAILAR